MEPPVPGPSSEYRQPVRPSPRGSSHDGEAYAGLVAVLFRDLAPAILNFLTRLERTFDLGRAFGELVEFIEPNSPPITRNCCLP